MTDRHDAPGGRPIRTKDGTSSPAAEESDAQLLAALATGDHAALAALYDEWFGRAMGLARTIARRDESFCLDVVQETFVRVIDHAPKLARMRTRADLDRWMAAVVRSAAIDLLRRDLRRTSRERSRPSDTVSAEQTVASDRATWLHEQLRELDADDAELLSLRFARGATLNGAAKAVGLTLGATYGRIRRAIAHMTRNAEEIDRE